MKHKIHELEKVEKKEVNNGLNGIDEDLFKDDKKPGKKHHKHHDHTHDPKIVFHKEKTDEEKEMDKKLEIEKAIREHDKMMEKD